MPDELYAQIERLAKDQNRALDDVAAELLARGVATNDRDEATLMEEIRAEREALARRGVWTTNELIRQARDEGRP